MSIITFTNIINMNLYNTTWNDYLVKNNITPELSYLNNNNNNNLLYKLRFNRFNDICNNKKRLEYVLKKYPEYILKQYPSFKSIENKETQENLVYLFTMQSIPNLNRWNYLRNYLKSQIKKKVYKNPYIKTTYDLQKWNYLTDLIKKNKYR